MSSEAHGDVADDTAQNAKGTDVQVGAEEVDVADLSNKESKGLKRRGEQFLEVRKVLEAPREKAREEVGFGSRTCSCEFRVTRKRVLRLEQEASKAKEKLGASGAVPEPATLTPLVRFSKAGLGSTPQTYWRNPQLRGSS